VYSCKKCVILNNNVPFSLVSTWPPNSVFSDINQSDYSEREGRGEERNQKIERN